MTDYHWTPANQRIFLETISETGLIGAATSAANMSRPAAYRFRRRAEGAAFALGWKAAVLLARDRLEDDLLERALLGQEEELIRDPDNNRILRKRTDNRLGMAALTRLDRMAGSAEPGIDIMAARIVAGDFERFLDMLEAGGGGAGAGLFLAGRAQSLPHCYLPQISAPFDQNVDGDEGEDDAISEPAQAPTIEERAAAMSVWWDDRYDEWRTDFPPPPDFDDEAEGSFGEEEYSRSLTYEEARIAEAQRAVATAPLYAAAEAARQAWLLVDPAVQAEIDAIAEAEAAEHAVLMAEIKAQQARAEAERQRSADEEAERAKAFEATLAEPKAVEAAEITATLANIPASPARPYYGLGGQIPPWAEQIW